VSVQEFLARLQGVKPTDKGWEAKCPAHDDRHASLTVAEGDDGRVLVRCHAGTGCSFEEIVGALGLKPGDLFDHGQEQSGRRIVATYDYEDEHGALLFQAVRYEPKQFLQRRPDGRGGWIWRGSTRRVLYRLPRVLEAIKAGKTIYVVEGEKDVHALEAVGEVATCNPMGAGKWRDTFSKILRGADVIIVQDRDDEGRKHAAKVASSLQGIAASVCLMEAVEGKDAADHLAAGKTIAEFVRVEPDNPDTRTTDAKPASLSGNDVREANRTPPGLALEADILAELRGDLKLAGLAGEHRGAEITFLSLTSRLLPWGKPTNRPVSAIGRGTTSSGKSATQRTVLLFFPPESYFDLGSMSKRFLVYSDEPLAHRFIVVPEWSSIAKDDEIVASLRTLLSEGRLVHGTVDGEGKREARRIEKGGPTGLLMTTTAAYVDAELETRCLSFVTDDSPAQTRRVFEVLADLEDDDGLTVDFERWHDLQRWLAVAENRAVIPYVQSLAELMPDGAPRLRRDFISVLCLTRAHAILHQATRDRDERGRIVAEIADYRAVHQLLDAIVAEAVDASVSPATRETVGAVRELLDESEYTEHTSVKKITDVLGIGRSATYDRVRRALGAGFLVNLAKENERGLKIALGAELPAGGAFLPSPDDLVVRVSSGEATGLANGVAMRNSEELSGSPGRPVNPRTNDICTHPVLWLARDGKRRCMSCEPPAFSGEIVRESSETAA
jgi:5S rRNA maturation endonuclease (ribonuclease M5)